MITPGIYPSRPAQPSLQHWWPSRCPPGPSSSTGAPQHFLGDSLLHPLHHLPGEFLQALLASLCQMTTKLERNEACILHLQTLPGTKRHSCEIVVGILLIKKVHLAVQTIPHLQQPLSHPSCFGCVAHSAFASTFGTWRRSHCPFGGEYTTISCESPPTQYMRPSSPSLHSMIHHWRHRPPHMCWHSGGCPTHSEGCPEGSRNEPC